MFPHVPYSCRFSCALSHTHCQTVKNILQLPIIDLQQFMAPLMHSTTGSDASSSDPASMSSPIHSSSIEQLPKYIPHLDPTEARVWLPCVSIKADPEWWRWWKRMRLIQERKSHVRTGNRKVEALRWDEMRWGRQRKIGWIEAVQHSGSRSCIKEVR
jgi:hypothetical protein